mmetsp:Transcript_20387/g.28132  ORF Transcript_20387/g.28132 Transcript_20387/m.28132 type:complete len:131 (-) Transcript_20387:1924-2316(-)
MPLSLRLPSTVAPRYGLTDDWPPSPAPKPRSGSPCRTGHFPGRELRALVQDTCERSMHRCEHGQLGFPLISRPFLGGLTTLQRAFGSTIHSRSQRPARSCTTNSYVRQQTNNAASSAVSLPQSMQDVQPR